MKGNDMKRHKIKFQLTEEQSEYKRRIHDVLVEVANIRVKHADLIDGCKHFLRPLTDKEIEEGEGAVCEICLKGFSWRCSKSPDGVCHYDIENGLIRLIDGSLVQQHPDHYVDYESDGSCVFCGEPDDRS
jgi:hypothetical protein